MISPRYAVTMAAYNRWQNACLYAAASRLSDAQRRENRGAYFGSLHATLCHLIIGDRIWMCRFTGDDSLRPAVRNPADAATFIRDWETLVAERETLDARIVGWARDLDPKDLEGDLTYVSFTSNRRSTRPIGLLVAHMFNHQTHHRGQAHALLTGFGIATEDTDMPLMPAV